MPSRLNKNINNFAGFLQGVDNYKDRLLFVFIKPYWPRKIIPNHITYIRVIIGILIFVLLFFFGIENKALILTLFCLGALTDFIDGPVARGTNKVTEFGAMLDSTADRILILPIAIYSLYQLNKWLLLALILVELGNAIASIYYKSKEIYLESNIFGKVKMVLQSLIFVVILIMWPNQPSQLLVDILLLSLIFAFLSIFMRIIEIKPAKMMKEIKFKKTKKMKIYNTLTGKKNILKPRNGKKINLFVCGPTVYDFSHIGHARTYVAFDVFVKYLRYLKYNVFYLQNITNIDDKIIMRARERQVPAKDLAMAFDKENLKDMKSLGVNSVNKYARATDYIKEIIGQVTRLIEKGYAYQLADGIYFDISKFKNYGKLSGRTITQAEDSISRIDYSKEKRNRGDFCLWKFYEPGEPFWKSPWGDGRPGWHIEDTAITEKFFGPQYDIHGGARDLIFPHHEAEVSQMEAISGKKPLVKYWMHTGFLTVNGQKMSKSLGNFMTIQDFLKRFTYRQLRFLIIKNLWRTPLDYSESAMIEVKGAIEKIEEFLRKIKSQKSKVKISNKNLKLIKKFKKDFYKELDDDFNTPKAFAVLFDFMGKINLLLEKNSISQKEAEDIYDFFEEINKIFDIIDYKLVNQKIPANIKNLAKEREVARKNQEWQKADEIRAEIEKQGFEIEDTKDGPIIKKR